MRATRSLISKLRLFGWCFVLLLISTHSWGAVGDVFYCEITNLSVISHEHELKDWTSENGGSAGRFMLRVTQNNDYFYLELSSNDDHTVGLTNHLLSPLLVIDNFDEDIISYAGRNKSYLQYLSFFFDGESFYYTAIDLIAGILMHNRQVVSISANCSTF
jgi:hypothetical protein